MKIREDLTSLYKSRQADFTSIRQIYPDEDMAGPLLMSPNNLYEKQPSPLLVVGQETYGWSYDVDDIGKQMQAYETFNVGASYYASPFWNVVRKIEDALGNEPFSCSWTNVSKFDHDGGRAQGEYAAAISSLDGILVDEISLLQPKVCLFLTGPSFDDRIRKIFNGLEFQAVENFQERELSRLTHPKLPTLSFRTYHPNFLRRSGLEKAVVNFIKSIR